MKKLRKIKKSIKQYKLRQHVRLVLLTLVILAVVLALLLHILNNHAIKLRDKERRSDLITLQTQIESYFRNNARYPTLSELNDPAFRKANLPGITAQTLQDPKWTAKQSNCNVNGLVIIEGTSAPSLHCYAYEETPIGCTVNPASCTGYTLTSKLETGFIYSVSHNL